MTTNRFGTSPLGSPTQRKRPTKARVELLKSFFEFLEHEPTTAESEMLDTIISCFMWSHRGYETVFHAAHAAHRCIHREDATWKIRPKKSS
jgi:hypothetical protein